MSRNHATRVIVVDPDQPDPTALELAAEILRQGGLVAFATETVYGLGAIATDPAAVARIFAAKGRPAINPVIVHVAGVAQATRMRRRMARDGADARPAFLARSPHARPQPVRHHPRPGDGRHRHRRRACSRREGRPRPHRTDGPADRRPSANRANRISPTRAEHVLADLDGRIDLIIDSGPTALGLESTVLDLTTPAPRLLRPGPISIKELEAVLAESVVDNRRH